jgi:hypothetical protein
MVQRPEVLARGCSLERIVAAVSFQSIGAFVTGLAVVAIGAVVTAVLFPLPLGAEIALIAIGLVALVIVVATIVLVRRGMVSAAARLARRLRLISHARHDRWRARLEDLDRRLRGERSDGSSGRGLVGHRAIAMLLVGISQLLQRGVIWVTLIATGYSLAGVQLVAVISAGVLLTWLSAVIPLGVGVAEGGNGALFTLIGAPASLGVALVLARRVNQIIFAAVGFAVLALDRMAAHADSDAGPIVPTPVIPR